MLMPVDLFFRSFGGGGDGAPPLVILHGLLGSSRNWMTAGAELGRDRHVVALDLRNHGESPHTGEHTYPFMAEDVLAWMDARGIGRAHLLGHSMGGKAAMRLAADHPERVGKLVVVDIAPRNNPPYNQRAFAAMNALPVSEIRSRKDAEKFLEERIPSWAFRQFLLTSLVRDRSGGFDWQVNLPVLTESLPHLARSPLEEDEQFGGDALFVRGGRSDFVRDEDAVTIRKHFPASRIDTIEDCGHNPHMEQREAFNRRVQAFLES